MAEHSAIEWCDHTFNPWEGCQKVSPGCENCYAEARNARFGGGVASNWGPSAPRRRTSAGNWRKPLQWQAGAPIWRVAFGRRQRVFCASLADVFDPSADESWRLDLFWLIHKTPDLDWMLLTKRIGNAASMIRDAVVQLDPAGEWPARLPNLWIGATVVNQVEADRDIPKLLDTPAAVRFLSIEPMLGPISLDAMPFGPRCTGCGEPVHLDAFTGSTSCLYACDGPNFDGIDWVICGGESGPNARPMHPDWARSLRDQCAAAGVAFLFKQWGTWLPAGQDGAHDHDPLQLNASDEPIRVGKKAAGRLLDGRTHDGFPLSSAA